MPSFNGVDLGPFVKMRTFASRVELQLTAYPGVNGLAALAMGSRGGVSEASGACVGADYAALADVEQQFRTMQANAVLGVLIDSLGTAWPNVLILDFRPVDEVVVVPGYGYGREYHMEFLHLS